MIRRYFHLMRTHDFSCMASANLCVWCRRCTTNSRLKKLKAQVMKRLRGPAIIERMEKRYGKV